MATGASAYIRLQKPDNEISQALQFGTSQMNDLGREYRDRNEREKVRYDKKISDWETEHKLNMDDFVTHISGFKDYDDIGRDATLKAMDFYVKAQRDAEEGLKTGNIDKQRDGEMRMMNIKSSLKKINNMTDAFGKSFSDYLEKVKNGTLSGISFDSFEKQAMSISKDKDFAFNFDDIGNPYVVGVVDRKTGKPIPYSLKYEDIVNGDFRSYDKVNLLGKGGIIDNLQNNIGSYETRTPFIENGIHKIKTSISWDDRIKQGVRDQIGDLLANPESKADLLYQISNGKISKNPRTDEFTKEDDNLIVDKIFSILQASGKFKDKIEIDKETENIYFNRAKLAESKRQANLKSADNRARIAAMMRGQNLTHEAAMAKLKAVKDSKMVGNVGESFEYNQPFGGEDKVDKNGNKLKPTVMPFKTFTLYDNQGKRREISGVKGDKPISAVEISQGKYQNQYMRIHYMDGTSQEIWNGGKATPNFTAILNDINKNKNKISSINPNELDDDNSFNDNSQNLSNDDEFNNYLQNIPELN